MKNLLPSGFVGTHELPSLNTINIHPTNKPKSNANRQKKNKKTIFSHFRNTHARYITSKVFKKACDSLNLVSPPILPSEILWSVNPIEDSSTRIMNCLHVILLLGRVKVLGRIKAGLVSSVLVLLLFVALFGVVLNVPSASGQSGDIYIRADGSIDPPTANITTTDYVTYTFTGNINDSIVVERNSIIVEGAGYTVTGYGYGIDLVNRSDVTIRNVTIKRGVWLESSYNCKLSGNNITDIIQVVLSSNNTIQGNNITSGGIGLQRSSNNNTISSNTITWTNGFGVEVLTGSSHNIIVGNNITDSVYGIELGGSNNTVSANIMNGNEVNFEVSGDYPGHSIDVSNLVNGKPVYYLVNQKDLMINPVTYPEIGYLALINCTNATVESLTLTDQSFPIVNTRHSRIANNNMTNVGVQILESSNITIYGNSKTSNNSNKRQGIYVGGSDKITISKNNLANSWDAIAFESSSDNIVSGNNMVNNTRGISLWDGAENITICENNLTNNTHGGLYVSGYDASAHVYHNNFTDNAIQVYHIYYDRGYLILDGGYPSGGNYWSDYTGVDEKSGPNQDQPGSDGIGDAPYIIDENNRDHYPLMESWTPPEHELVVSMAPLSFLKLGNSTLIDASVANQGSNDEIGIEFSLFINDTIANSTTILLLQPDNSYTLEYLWAPTVEGTYNITAYAHPVPGETYIGNNRVSEFVTVSTTIVVPYSYPTIQAAITAANSGDTIFVKEGTYYEQVVINKSITLIGENRDRTIIDGSSTGTVLNITVSHVNIMGFTIQKSGYWPYCGIHVSSGFNNISYNIIRNCDYFYAIELINSSNTIISRNFITANKQTAVYLFNSSGNVLSENNITYNEVGISISGSTFDPLFSSGNTVFGNNITNNSVMDISLYRSPSNIISQNNIANSPIGIHIIDDPSINITIRENNITNNTIGILFSSNSLDNTIYHNNFVNNTQQVNTPYSVSVWDDGYPSGGNYWSDYSGVDANHDGIGDTPYQIDSNNADNYPLMTSYIIPEFPTFLILPLLMLATLVAVIFFRREHIIIK